MCPIGKKRAVTVDVLVWYEAGRRSKGGQIVPTQCACSGVFKELSFAYI